MGEGTRMESRAGRLDVLMDVAEVSQPTLDVCYLASRAVRGEVPDAGRISSMDLGAVYALSCAHLLVSACATALESAGVFDERFVQEWGKAVRKTAVMDAERARLFSLMDAAGIWHVPLKGCVLEGLYPAYGMRQMSDNDILFDAKYAEEVRDMMLSLGFTCEHFDKGAHDVYFKEPVCNFELHRMLFAKTYDERTYAYYADAERLFVADGEGTYGMHFSDEDFYVYLMAHAKKHFSSGGTGLRILFDTYVYVRERADAMDWGYVTGELLKLGLTEFEGTCRDVAVRLIDGGELLPEDLEMLRYLADSGAYGTTGHRIANEIARRGRLGYFFHRVFMPYETMKTLYPVLDRVPILLPACWVLRLGKGALVKREKVSAELKALLRQ